MKPKDTRWYTITVDRITRVGVQAWNAERAWETFLATRFPIGESRGRRIPPRREDCTIRRATFAEIADYQKSRRKPTQDSMLFNGDDYNKMRRR